MLLKKAIYDFLAAIENHVDVCVARGPHIVEEFRALLLGEWSEGVAQFVESLAQGCAPFLVPSRLAAVAAAVGTPALDAVRTTPRGVFDDFALALRRKLREKAGVVGQLDGLVLLEKAQRISQSHFAVPMMVAVGLAVGGHVYQLRLCGVFEAAI